MALAQLSIDLVAQTAKFEADMRRAAGVVQQAANRIDSSFAGIGVAAGVGAALGTVVTQVVGRLPEVAAIVLGIMRDRTPRIDEEIANELIALTPESWRAAVLEVKPTGS